MNTQKIKDIRQRLESEYDHLIRSISRNRIAVEDIRIENTEDEGDLASISHERDVLYNLHEGDFARLRFIQQALRAITRGNYGECIRCGEDITEKRLEAVPWARMCVSCQEEAEAADVSSRMALAGKESDDPE